MNRITEITKRDILDLFQNGYENVFSITNRQVILEVMNLCLK